MRLDPQQIAEILHATHAVAGCDAEVWLYGSRLDDTRRGGDIDLLVKSSQSLGLLQRARIKNLLEENLQIPVDILAHSPEQVESPFVRIAKAQAVRLNQEVA
ncbi:MAG: hypothetical protein RLZZ298_590 [Pseudomonadota bacterium]|jgi:predicted nucleotidyltransferase